MTRLCRNTRGLSIMEMVCAVAIGSFILIVLARLSGKTLPFFQHTLLRQDLMTESRKSMQTITQLLRQGKAGTLVIDTPNTFIKTVPNSRINFAFQNIRPGGPNRCRIWLEDGKLFTQEFGFPGPPPYDQDPRLIASDVIGLMFTGDYRDPGLVSVTLHISKQWGSNENKKARFSSMLIPNQTVRMSEAP